MEEYMWIIWSIVLVVSLIVELMSTALLSLWFIIGSVVALILSFIPGIHFSIEIVSFVVVSIGTFLLVRPYLKKMMKKDIIKTNAESVIGKSAIMTKACTALESGEAKVDGVYWSASSNTENDAIEVGTIVRIVAIKGNKLLVERVN